MADSVICDEIKVALLEKGPIVVPSDGAFRHVAGINGSSRAVKSALASLIQQGVVRRHRRMPEGCTDSECPVKFELAGPAFTMGD